MTAEMVTPEDPGLRRLPFIDGVRGVAAVVVMLGHLIFVVPAMTQPGLRDVGLRDLAAWPFRFGTEMVCLFLMVSGFSLHYSEASRRLRGRPASTYRQFAARRAWRIGPVYYVAIALGLAVLPLMGNLHLRPETARALHLTPGGVVAHLAFVHNMTAGWYFQVNSPLWSIATEVQLYVLFPMIFWAARRWNPLLVCGAIAAVDLVIDRQGFSFPIFALARWFVLGILLAEVTARGFRVPARVALPVGIAALALAMAQLAALGSTVRHDAVWAVAFVALMLAAIRHPESRRNPMTWAPVRWVGLRSYSLYALHWPVLLLLLLADQRAGITRWAAAGVDCLFGVPLALAVVAASYRWVEAPSLRRVGRVGRVGQDSRPTAEMR